LAIATLAGMTLFTWLTLVGMERFRLDRFERWEAGMLSGLFFVLGVLALLMQHDH
jgi:nickel/cobalt exporter